MAKIKRAAGKTPDKTRPAGRPSKDKPWEPSAPQLQIYAEVCSGLSHAVVAAKHHISRIRVGAICHQIDSWFVPQYLERIKELKCGHTNRLMFIYTEAMAAWGRSQKEAVEVTETETETEKGGFSSSSRKKKGRDGSYQFLETAKDALKQIREIWGANAPLKIEHSGELRVAGMSVEQANADLRARLAEAQQRLTTPGRN